MSNIPQRAGPSLWRRVALWKYEPLGGRIQSPLPKRSLGYGGLCSQEVPLRTIEGLYVGLTRSLGSFDLGGGLALPTRRVGGRCRRDCRSLNSWRFLDSYVSCTVPQNTIPASTWTKACTLISCWAVSRGFRPFFSILLLRPLAAALGL